MCTELLLSAAISSPRKWHLTTKILGVFYVEARAAPRRSHRGRAATFPANGIIIQVISVVSYADLFAASAHYTRSQSARGGATTQSQGRGLGPAFNSLAEDVRSGAGRDSLNTRPTAPGDARVVQFLRLEKIAVKPQDLEGSSTPGKTTPGVSADPGSLYIAAAKSRSLSVHVA